MNQFKPLKNVKKKSLLNQLKNNEMKNISIYDNQGETFDRITIVFDNKKTKTKDGIIYEGIGASEDGRGFLQHTICMKGKHLGKKITFQELHKNLQDFIKNYLSQNK